MSEDVIATLQAFTPATVHRDEMLFAAGKVALMANWFGMLLI